MFELLIIMLVDLISAWEAFINTLVRDKVYVCVFLCRFLLGRSLFFTDFDCCGPAINWLYSTWSWWVCSIVFIVVAFWIYFHKILSSLSQISESMDALIKQGLRGFCSGTMNENVDVPQIALELLTTISKSDFSNEKAYTHWHKRQVTPNKPLCASMVLYDVWLNPVVSIPGKYLGRATSWFSWICYWTKTK